MMSYRQRHTNTETVTAKGKYITSIKHSVIQYRKYGFQK